MVNQSFSSIVLIELSSLPFFRLSRTANDISQVVLIYKIGRKCQELSGISLQENELGCRGFFVKLVL